MHATWWSGGKGLLMNGQCWPAAIELPMSKKAYAAHPEVPISKAVRAGDFVFTSAYGPWTFDPTKVVFDGEGGILDDGTGRKNVPFEDQVHMTMGFIRDALAVAGCTLDDV